MYIDLLLCGKIANIVFTFSCLHSCIILQVRLSSNNLYSRNCLGAVFAQIRYVKTVNLTFFFTSIAKRFMRLVFRRLSRFRTNFLPLSTNNVEFFSDMGDTKLRGSRYSMDICV